MRTAVIVLDYFGAARTRVCLRSLAGEPVNTVYVVDNGATPHSHAALREVVDALQAEQPGWVIRVLRPETNLGFAAGVNLAIAADRESSEPHDFYLLVNNDAVAAPGMLEVLVATWLAGDPYTVVGPEVLDGQGGRHREVGYQRHLGLLTYRPRRGYFSYLSGCCLGVPAAVLRDARLLDEDFFMYGEETALGWELARRGVRMRCVPGAQVTHDAGNRFGVYGLFYEYHMARAHLLLALKTVHTPLEVPLLLALKLPLLAARALLRSFRYRDATPLRALFMAPFRCRVRPPARGAA